MGRRQRYEPAPMRACIVWLCQQPWRWDERSVWSMARSQPARARAYLTHLVHLRVLVRQEGEYRQGPVWLSWSQQFSRTHPGGHSRAYRRDANLRAETYREQHRERQQLAGLLRSKRAGRPVLAIARAAGVSHSVLFDLEAGRITVRAETLARIMQALEVGCRAN
jgi:hypothetical protein